MSSPATAAPPLPPGYEADTPAATTSPLPPGYEADVSPGTQTDVSAIEHPGAYLYTTPEGIPVYAKPGSTLQQINAPPRPTEAGPPDTLSGYARAGADYLAEGHPNLDKYLINPIMQTAGEATQGWANVVRLGQGATHFIGWLGQQNPFIPREHRINVLQGIEDALRQSRQNLEQEAYTLEGNRQDVGSKVIRTVAGAAMNMPAYIAATELTGGLGLPLMGALENATEGPGASAKGAALGAAQQIFMSALGPYGRLVRFPLNTAFNAALGATQAPPGQSVDPVTNWANALLMGGLSALPGRQPYPNWVGVPDRFKFRPQLNPLQLQAQEYMRNLGIQRPIWMDLGTEGSKQLGASVMRGLGGGYLKARIDEGTEQLIDQGRRQLEQGYPTPVTGAQAGREVIEKIAGDLEQQKAGLAQQVSPQPETPESAGQSLLNRRNELIQNYDKQADQAYTNAWKAEQDPRNWEAVPVRDKAGDLTYDQDGNVIRKKMALPVDVSEEQDALRPVLDEWESTWEPTRKAASVGLVALRNLVNGDRYQSARALEKNISMLKEAARTEDLPQLRDVSQGLAAMALKRVQAKVDQTMATAHYPGWDESSGQPSPALTNLQAGRKATAQKYDIQDRFKPLMGGKPPQQVEPVQAYGRMVWGGDTGIRNLQRVAEVAPDQMPQVGRAFIDSDGKWNQLGPETKKVLFKDPNVIEGLDKYYELHQKYGNLRDMEPAALYNKMTSEGQGRLEFLNDIASRAPDQMPLVERAYFQGLLDTLTRKGDISNLESTFNSYLNMDPRVKRILINDPARTRDWNSFFVALREMMNNPNPSGSGFMFGINQLKSKVTTGVTMGLGGLVGGLHGGAPGAGAGAGLGLVGSGVLDIVSNAALARLMMNDRLRRMLVRGMQEQNRGNLPAARLAARTVSQMVQNEPPEDPHGGPPGGGDVR